MAPAQPPPRPVLLAAGILLLVFFCESFFASLGKSPVFDEPPHIASGISYIETGVFHGNLQHPPLLKEISGLFLSLAGIHWPKSAEAQAMIGPGGEGKLLDWRVGNEILLTNGPGRVLFWARLPFILLATALGALIFIWGRQMLGDHVALGALFLYTFDPTILAHSYLVTTDSGMAAFTVLFFFALWHYVRQPGRKRLLLCGLALGALLATKFSALALAPVAAVLMWAALRWPAAQAAGKVEPDNPCPCGSAKKFKNCHGRGKAPAVAPQGRYAAQAGSFVLMLAAAAVVITLLYWFQPLLFLDGVRLVNADHLANYRAYLHGQLAPRFLGYFAAAYLLKEPLPAIALTAAGLILLWRQRETSILLKWFLLLPPLVLFAGYSAGADNIGVRYLIPALPFAFLLGGIALAALFRGGALWPRCLAGALCVWAAAGAVAIYPDHLSYFNESACLLEEPGKVGFDGGTRCGPLWLDDSNVDWGQGLKQLREWQIQRGQGRTLRLGYTVPFPPDAYGLKYDLVGPEDLTQDPAPGLYAISANLVALIPAAAGQMQPARANWLRRIPPAAIVGHAFYIYDIH